MNKISEYMEHRKHSYTYTEHWNALDFRMYETLENRQLFFMVRCCCFSYSHRKQKLRRHQKNGMRCVFVYADSRFVLFRSVKKKTNVRLGNCSTDELQARRLQIQQSNYTFSLMAI